MKCNNKQLTARLVDLRNAIKRKYKVFKEGAVESDIMLEKQYKPIIKELRKTTNIKNEVKEEPKEESMDYELTGSEGDDDDDFSPSLTSTPKPQELSELVSSPAKLASTTQFVKEYFTNPLTQEYMTMFLKDAGSQKKMDYVYGPRYNENTLMVGSKTLDFNRDGKITIGGVDYGASEGLYELLFKRFPDSGTYTDEDLKAYKSILNDTNAHREGYSYNGKIKSNKSQKYVRIIKKLFPPVSRGRGMAWKSAGSRDIIHWDDPDELVERLRHIVMSTETGNRVHRNEIISIIEELREAGFIKGAGNNRFKALLQ